MALSIITFLFTVIVSMSSSKVFATGDQQIQRILSLIHSQNHSLQAAKQAQMASKHMGDGFGYFPDPNVRVNVFGSPIETRNGPQKSNIMVTQSIPWLSALRAEEQLATSMAKIKAEEVEILILDLTFKAKSLIYKYVELTGKSDSKNKMIATLNNLNRVVLSRLKLGSVGQAEIYRVNIEVAQLAQSVRRIQSKMFEIKQNLARLAGGKSVEHLLPKSIDHRWVQSESFDPGRVDISSHPMIRLMNAKVHSARADIDQVRTKRLPKIGVSVSWFQIGESNPAMLGADAGKDAWAIGASISLPIWSRKYDSIEYSRFAKQSAAELELRQKHLDLRSRIQSVYEEFQSAKDISSMLRNDIIPQANQALKADRESYTQGGVTFERVIENYLRVVKFEEQLIESQIKQAALKATIENLVGRKL